jgi:hypothetical protein
LKYTYNARTHGRKIQLDVNTTEIGHGVNVSVAEMIGCRLSSYHKAVAIFLTGKCLILGKGLVRFVLHGIHLRECTVIFLNSPVAVIHTITVGLHVCVCVCVCVHVNV